MGFGTRAMVDALVLLPDFSLIPRRQADMYWPCAWAATALTSPAWSRVATLLAMPGLPLALAALSTLR